MAGTGLTGLNLGDLDPARGMSTLVQWTTRTWPSSCSNHGTELFFTNDDGLYMLDMFEQVPEPGEVATLSGQPHRRAQVDCLLAMYRRAKVELQPRSRPAAARRCRGSSTSTSGTPTSPAPPSSSRSPTRPSSTSTCCSSTCRAATGSRSWTSATGARSAGLQYGARLGTPRPRAADGDHRAGAAGAVDAGGGAGLHLPEHQPRPPGARPRAAGRSPATSRGT